MAKGYMRAHYEKQTCFFILALLYIRIWWKLHYIFHDWLVCTFNCWHPETKVLKIISPSKWIYKICLLHKNNVTRDYKMSKISLSGIKMRQWISKCLFNEQSIKVLMQCFVLFSFRWWCRHMALGYEDPTWRCWTRTTCLRRCRCHNDYGQWRLCQNVSRLIETHSCFHVRQTENQGWYGQGHEAGEIDGSCQI